MQRRRNVVKVVFERIAHAFADVGVSGEVHDQFDFFVAQNGADQQFVAQIHVVKRNFGRERGAMAVNQIVQYDRAMAGLGEQTNAMRADVTGAADN